MKILIFGATGMVGQGVLRQCLLDPEVQLVVTVGRNPAGKGKSGLKGPNCGKSFTATWQIFPPLRRTQRLRRLLLYSRLSRQAG